MRLFSAVENVLLIDFDPIVGIFDDYRYGYRALPSGTITYVPLDSGTSQFGIQGLRSGALYEITLDTRRGAIYTEVDRIQARTSKLQLDHMSIYCLMLNLFPFV